MATFGEVKTRIARKYKGSQAASFLAVVGDAINDAVDKYQREDMWFREATASFNLVVGASTLSDNPSFPSDFSALRADSGIVISQSSNLYKLEKIRVESFDAADIGGSGRPRYYRELSGEINIYPLPDSAYPCYLRYLKKYSALTDNSSTNDWLTHGPLLIEAAALASLFLSEGHDGATMYAFWKAQEDEQARALRVTHNRRVATGDLAMEGW